MNDIQYDRDTMLAMVNSEPIIYELCRKRADEVGKEIGESLEAWWVSLEQIFYETIKNDRLIEFVEKWDSYKPQPKERIYEKLKDYKGISKEIYQLINLNGWKEFMKGLEEFADIKRRELQNGGFDFQVEHWEKIKQLIHKAARVASGHVMT